MEQTTLPIIILAFVLGMKHALDVDHLAAVTTLLTGRRNRWKAVLVGIWWGLGHSAALMLVGGMIILFDVRFPDSVSLILEFCVGLMLIFLGVRVLLRLRKGGTLHVHTHEHGGRVHIHPHLHEAGTVHAHGNSHDAPNEIADAAAPGGVAGAAGRRPLAPKTPLLVGMVHGLAGSAGLTLLLLPSIPTRLMGIVYLALFGAGSILGMTLATFLVSIPLGEIGTGGRAGRLISAAAGCLSFVVGGVLMVETGGALLVP
jgi:hypothetical protein